MYKKYVIFLGLLFSSNLLADDTKPVAKEESLYITAGNLVLDSEDHLVKPVAPSAAITTDKKKEKTNTEKVSDMIKPLVGTHKKEIVFNLFAEHGLLKEQKSKVIEPYVLRELSLLCGSEKSKKANVFVHLNKNNQTVFGSAVLARKLSEPLTNKEEIIRNQNILKMLIVNKPLANKLTASLKNIGENEDLFLNFWNPQAQLDPNIGQIIYAPGFLAHFNKRPAFLEFWRKYNGLSFGLALLSLPISAIMFHMYPFKIPVGERRVETPLANSRENYGYNFSTYHYEKVFMPRNTAIAVSAVAGGLWDIICIFTARQLYDQIKLINHSINTLHTKMKAVRVIVDACDKLHKAVSEQPDLVAGFKTFAKLHEFVRTPYALSAELDKLINMLEHPIFEQDPTLFSNSGYVLAAHKIMEDVKNHFLGAMEAVGEIDSYLSVAKTVDEYSTKRVKYSFVNIVDQKTPHIELKEVWNPLIDSEKVVTEDIIFGKPNGAHNIMLTGPHGGGKSTFMKSVAYCIYLGLIYGIAPATSATITIFDKINSYVNIKEDLGKEQSTFMAELARVNEISNVLTKLKPGQLSFSIMDEVFKGTMEEEGSVRLCRFGKSIANIDQSICMIATHFKEPAQLEEDTKGEFSNYHVGLIEQNDNTFVRTFKLIKGNNEWWFNDAAKRRRYIEWLTSIM